MLILNSLKILFSCNAIQTHFGAQKPRRIAKAILTSRKGLSELLLNLPKQENFLRILLQAENIVPVQSYTGQKELKKYGKQAKNSDRGR